MEENKELTLKDLNPNIKQEEVRVKPVNVSDIVKNEPTIEDENVRNTPMDDIFGDLEKASDSIFEQARGIVVNMYEQKELNEIDSKDELSDIGGESYKLESENQERIIEEDELLMDEDEDIDINDFDDDDKERLNVIKADIKQKIQPFMKKIDIASFTISSKPSKVHKLFDQKLSTENVADWVLYSTGIPISMKEFKAIDIEKLSPSSSSQNKINTYRTIYRQFYEHLDGDVPEFEVWLKMVHFYDLDHLYMAAFYASFGKSNLVPYMCNNPKCTKKAFVKQFDDIWSMVKFNDEETKKKFHAILEGDTSFKKDAIESELVQISDNYVVGLKIPTLYSVIYEQYSLSEQYQERNRDVLALLTFIDTIYVINYEVFLKTYDDDLIKTIHYKIKTYKDILESITSDQYFYLQQLISNISKNLVTGITYQLPEAECPYCNRKQEAQDYTGESLLFMRHRLPGIASI